MKVQTLKGTMLHIAKDPLAQILLDSGLITEVKDFSQPAVAEKLPTNWTVGIVAATGTPFIEARCPNQPCASQHLKHIAQGPNAATQTFWHCGKGEVAPPEIADRFIRFQKKAKPARPEQIFDPVEKSI